ncbi:MAG: hypothetical protein HYR93_05135 [Chloroflexi bacterium]|nr:hypothetical protein [Chloroflexota bacterium]
MNNIVGLLFIILFGGAGLISIFAIVNLVLPAPVERARLALETSLGRSLLLGVVNFLFAGVVGVVLALPIRAGGDCCSWPASLPISDGSCLRRWYCGRPSARPFKRYSGKRKKSQNKNNPIAPEIIGSDFYGQAFWICWSSVSEKT